MDPADKALAEAARGFMPPDEGVALYEAALATPEGSSPLLEVGSYCGKSALYLGPAAKAQGRVVFSVDHHRGSEENQQGWPHHEPDLLDSQTGSLDTLPEFRRNMRQAGLEGTVVAIVGDSPTVARIWKTPLALLFIDGGHGTEPAHLDLEGWSPHVEHGGLLVIHDVFPDPADGGRPPFEIYCRALESGLFHEERAVGSLRVLRRSDAVGSLDPQGR